MITGLMVKIHLQSDGSSLQLSQASFLDGFPVFFLWLHWQFGWCSLHHMFLNCLNMGELQYVAISMGNCGNMAINHWILGHSFSEPIRSFQEHLHIAQTWGTTCKCDQFFKITFRGAMFFPAMSNVMQFPKTCIFKITSYSSWSWAIFLPSIMNLN